MVRPSQGKLVYHLTSLSNAASIFTHGLLSRNDLHRRGLSFGDVADPEILLKRQRHQLADYVPFHFFPRNPFDYAVCRTSPDEPMVLLATTRSHAHISRWLILPRHPLADEFMTPLPWSEGYRAIDWDLLDQDKRDYTDHDCKVACMAEALSPTPVRVRDITLAFVKTHIDAERIKAYFGSKISVNPGMFP
ncbi:DarT ssDNA thymidine ADP-ribosyltransferase family protein [Nannocystis sp. SCPEA4]|uniref:DarT ssDNA thymidine ADP-ribosyltransferase family protein n=1 Tax=Nannocystis sp. SCPEA4 TaxID=2996787 RepID=UPI00226EB605|nr:DarT ssDNA thymidine ADP-ribosyltransferase family protein [Nannocystis sp. SCPEA4]MCY1058186.1 DarT ssDNA thymidine ADP-ribosyltransferase family protein [Nannocystis sp. SCPEA4]